MIHLAAGIAALPRRRRRSVLLLGLGGGSAARVARALAPRARIVGVEIDPSVVRLARRWFDLDALGIEVVVEDARAYLEKCPRRFDAVLEISDRLAAVSEEHDYALWRTLATVLEGVARTALGEPERGTQLTEQGVALYQGLAPPPVFWPLVLGLRAGVHAMAGNLPRALELVDEAITIWEPMGVVPPELAIRRSELLVGLNGPDDPEAALVALQVRQRWPVPEGDHATRPPWAGWNWGYYRRAHE